MMRPKFLLALAAAAALSLPALAMANSVDVKGNLQRDGYLTLEFDWTVDTRDYPGQNRAQIEKKVHGDMYDMMLPKLVSATRGTPCSFDRSSFQMLGDNAKLVKERSDGTKVYAIKTSVRFNAPAEPSAPSSQRTVSSSSDMPNLKGNWQAEFW
jgi:hypothetical protein